MSRFNEAFQSAILKENSFAFAKINENALSPKRANPTDAGLDLSACETVTIPSGCHAAIDTGIAVKMIKDCYGRVAPRSGLALKHALDVLAGVVDAGYRDSIKVIMINHGKEDYTVKQGDRIAQLIFEKIHIPESILELSYDELCAEETDRGLAGFGSTDCANGDDENGGYASF